MTMTTPGHLTPEVANFMPPKHHTQLSLILLVIFISACNSATPNGLQSVTDSQTATAPSATATKTVPTSTTTPTTTPIPPTSTLTPSPTSTSSPTSSPTPTPSPSPTPTPLPILSQLTQGGCCVQPFFSPNGEQILFIDKPNPQAPTGIYGIEIKQPLSTPVLLNEIIGFRNPNRTIVVTLEGDFANFFNETSGESWRVNTGGNRVHFSPDGSQILWSATDREGPYDRRQSDIRLADLDGSNQRLLLSTYGGGFGAWLPTGQHILILNRDNLDQEERTLFLYDLKTEQRTDLVREKRLRGLRISPGGSWITYFLTFDDDPQKNGVWAVSSDGNIQQKLNLPGFGDYHWRNDNILLYIPIRTSAAESMQLWALDVSTNQSWPLTDPETLSFSISNGDWQISPTGQQIVFVNSADQNLWLITLP